MKISRKLKSQIDEAVYNEITRYLAQLERLERDGKISREAYHLAHERACVLPKNITSRVLVVIDLY